ncbi:MAG TPA: M55 family metallopeptidase [Anaerolineaceae bacterium]|nr:M55 family metallopeptidase [Anaerolineaceae bacterium]
MKILISVDMEGISGVTAREHVTPGNPDYERFRRVMTADVNSAIKGAQQAGADDILVVDGHWNAGNLLLEELDPRVRLISGVGSPLATVHGIDTGVAGLLLVGYHARRGSLNAILDHTWSSACVANLWLNGKLTGEIGLNAAVAGHFDVPLLMISGDQTTCAEAAELVPGIEAAMVKKAVGRSAAECLPLEIAHQRIREAAGRAIARLRAEMAPTPYRVQPPVLIAVEFIASDMADRAMLLPGTTRLDGERIQITAPDMVTGYRSFQAAVGLARS